MIAVCLKWVDHRVDPAVLDAPTPDRRFAGVSAADQAALEWGLRCRDARHAGEVVVITAGPPAAESVLRDALAAGADRAVRIDLPFGAPSRTVAAAIAGAIAGYKPGEPTGERTRESTGESTGESIIWCGDYSFDRGTGSVPAYIAHELGCAQALGLVAIQIGADSSSGIDVLRRLDGGRRERLAVRGSAVLSVEGSTALLRRAPLRKLLAKRPVEVIPVAATPLEHALEARPYRPRPRTFAPPVGATALERVKALTAAGTASASHGEAVTLDPAAAADRILLALVDWGYLP